MCKVPQQLLKCVDELVKMKPEELLIADFTYVLPNSQIAEAPLPQRDQSKLLIYKNGIITDDVFANLSSHVPGYSTVILNDTRVIEARLLFTKPTGGTIEIFCLEPYNQSIETAMQQQQKAVWKCLIGGASKWKPGQVLEKQCSGPNNLTLQARYIQKQDHFFLIELSWEPQHLAFVSVLHAAGAIPLPPYIKRQAAAADLERYQTIFGRHNGSVAAPTAALHFTEKVFESLHQNNIAVSYVTLHVGAGTFMPVKTELVGQHAMHSEPFTVSRKLIQNLLDATAIVAVGTTSLRTLESLYWMGVKVLNNLENPLELQQWEAYQLMKRSASRQQSLSALLQWMEKNQLPQLYCKTGLLIAPGYLFQMPTALITNFHQPQSTLLLLIAAFIGDDWKKVYQHALKNNYRFLSYGDSSVLWRNQS